jgi:hypothetical protein
MGHLHAAAALAAISTLTLCVSSAAARTTSDQPDDRPRTQQIHLVYAVPGDGPDRGYDVDGSIATSFAVAQAWLSGQTGGKAFTLDTAGGAADITFARLSQSDAEVASHGLYIPDFIAPELRARGLSDPWKVYLVYYDGSAHHNECGGAPSPGHVAALYLRGEFSDPAIPACDANPFATAGQPPGYREYSAIHELVHAVGFVAPCARHITAVTHVSDSPHDLMYAGPEPWTPDTLDVGRDDYFGAGIAGCRDLSVSGYLAGNPPAALPGETLPGTPATTTPSRSYLLKKAAAITRVKAYVRHNSNAASVAVTCRRLSDARLRCRATYRRRGQRRKRAVSVVVLRDASGIHVMR